MGFTAGLFCAVGLTMTVKLILTAPFPETYIANHELLCAHGLFEGTITLAYIYGWGVFYAEKEI